MPFQLCSPIRLQIFFDFSAYSEMAIGIAWMFGIQLPVNFNSPYKASSLIDFWRRWHITLSSFLRDYVYFPARGKPRRVASDLNQSAHRHVGRWYLARGRVDLRGLGICFTVWRSLQHTGCAG